MTLYTSIKKDLIAINAYTGISVIMVILFNRGFHSLISYRIANRLWKARVLIFPAFFTRVIQILYSIDIDYKCYIDAGVVIMHGDGIVIGKGATIEENVIIFHQVTLGRRKFGEPIPDNDGFPTIGRGVVLGAGAKLLGPISIGYESIIGANTVITKSVPPLSTVVTSKPIILGG
ncbi:hypothetical protein BFP72_17860 [Reichenbachiella sp. 5M10]|uniref:serine O-acetyltransferase n=1 Tax=Reichenbachiella sp. 5M10 TaxID=1889772 RepID=UPI000C14FB7B|nr:DapH/DapD/GlmU-related protein [Reichenbachiella sp. 5M10]PIB37138.1 hypothetical protein BFP72_17860 [Reichenbachiella sp. 5M10]